MPYAILAILAVLAVIVGLKSKEISEYLADPKVIEKAKELCKQAEMLFTESEWGLKRLEWVCEMMLKYAPPSIAKYISVELLKAFIHIVFESIATVTDDGHKMAI